MNLRDETLTAILTCFRLGLPSGGAAFAGGGTKPRSMMNKPCINNLKTHQEAAHEVDRHTRRQVVGPSCKGVPERLHSVLQGGCHPEADKQKAVACSRVAAVARSHHCKAEVGNALQMCVPASQLSSPAPSLNAIIKIGPMPRLLAVKLCCRHWKRHVR